ncbi:MAG: hypothetical protein KA371_17225 [Acidobacteria bacterium]|nr:hypothetical protein [Acidobacteriota bacterium]
MMPSPVRLVVAPPGAWLQRATAMVLAVTVAASAAVAIADEVRPSAIVAFDRYVDATEARMRADRQDGHLLWIDRLPEARRSPLERRLAAGDIVTERLTSYDGSAPIAVSDAIFLHALASVQLHDVTVGEVMALLLDVDHHAEIFAPTIRRSRTVGHEGDAVIVAGQFSHRNVVTITYNAEVETRCASLSATQAECRSVSRRGAMVADAGRPTEREKPFRGDARKQWFLRTYYRLEARGDGTRVEHETLFVCPPLARLLRIFTPLVRNVPAEVSEALLAGMHARLSPH